MKKIEINCLQLKTIYSMETRERKKKVDILRNYNYRNTYKLASEIPQCQ